MNTHLLVVLAASTLAGCATAQQATHSFTHSVNSLVQRVTAAVAPAAARAAQPAPAHPESPDHRFRTAYAMALTGDREAMVEVARIYGRGSNGVERDDRSMVEWLRKASELHHAGASYQLYLHYLERGMDRDALRYEDRALRQGYVLPVRLDPRRG